MSEGAMSDLGSMSVRVYPATNWPRVHDSAPSPGV